VLGRLDPRLGWTWKDEQGATQPYILINISSYAGMITGTISHSGVKATRPKQDFDLLSLCGGVWFPAQQLISLIPREMDHHGMHKPIVPVQIRFTVGMDAVL
jgi:hypothetical protein